MHSLECYVDVYFPSCEARRGLILCSHFQILVLRAVHEQLLRLLSTSEQNELRVNQAFSPFSGLHPLQYNPYTVPLWKAAVAQYDRAMAPAEQRIAGKLRNQFRGLEGNSQQVRIWACQLSPIAGAIILITFHLCQIPENCVLIDWWLSVKLLIPDLSSGTNFFEAILKNSPLKQCMWKGNNFILGSMVSH